jgi:hypothetical protein
MLAAGTAFLRIFLASSTPTPHVSKTPAVLHSVQPTAGTPQSIIMATWITAIATVVLAFGAGFTVYFAKRAFDKQTAEVTTLEGQATDQKELIRQQGELLRIQSGQLEAQRDQFAEQRKVNEKQVGVLELQAQELKASFEQREREAAERKFAQARLVSVILGPEERPPDGDPLTGRTPVNLINSSPEPVYRLVIGIVFIQGAGPRTIEEQLSLREDSEDKYRAVPITTGSTLPPGTHRIWIQGTGWSSILSGRGGAEVAFTDRAGHHWVRRATGELEELPEDPIYHYLKYGPHELQTPERIS